MVESIPQPQSALLHFCSVNMNSFRFHFFHFPASTRRASISLVSFVLLSSASCRFKRSSSTSQQPSSIRLPAAIKHQNEGMMFLPNETFCGFQSCCSSTHVSSQTMTTLSRSRSEPVNVRDMSQQLASHACWRVLRSSRVKLST